MDAFNEAAAVILDKLYQEFPLRIPLRDDSFGDLSDEQRPIYRDTIHFLANEGIIRYHSSSSGGRSTTNFELVTLTAKGLDILWSPADEGKPTSRQTLGERIGQMAKTLTVEATRIGLRELMERIIAGAV